MKRRCLLVSLFTLALFCSNLKAQEADSTVIEQVVLNYIENFFENKVEAMNKSLHPRLAKRGLNPDRSMSEDFPPETLAKLMSEKRAFPKSAQKNKVLDIKVFRDSATASLVTGYPSTRWVEYLHLVRQNGEWKIINVFWEFFEKKKP